MRWPTLVVVAAIATASCGFADTTCWLVVPSDKRAGSIYREAPQAFTRAGLRVASDKTPPANPDVVIVYPRSLSGGFSLDDVLQVSQRGAGLVVIYSSDLSRFEPRLLEPWHARIRKARADTARLELIDHPVVQGIGSIFVWRVPATIEGLRPLIRQGSNVIAAHGTRDGRRLVVLPLDAVVPGQANDVIPPPNMRLLVQAALWAAGQPVSAPRPRTDATSPSAAQTERGAQPTPEQLHRGSYRAIACVDMAADDEDWPQIREAVAKILAAAGLEVQPVRLPRHSTSSKDKSDQAPEATEPRRLPLIRALKDSPALVVLGSCRPLAEAEQVAVVAYVEAGGGLLALPRATHKTNKRLVWLNQLLIDFGLAATLARPAGEAVPVARRVARELKEIGKIPEGIRVVGGHTTPWVTVDGIPVAIGERYGSGRVGVIDPLPLVKAEDEQVRSAWEKLFSIMLQYLTAGMELR